MQCPKCNYLRTPDDTAPDWRCPACKVAYNKVKTNTSEKPKKKTKYRSSPTDIPEKLKEWSGPEFMIFGFFGLILVQCDGLVFEEFYTGPHRQDISKEAHPFLFDMYYYGLTAVTIGMFFYGLYCVLRKK